MVIFYLMKIKEPIEYGGFFIKKYLMRIKEPIEYGGFFILFFI